ncbi:hypothetical protein [Niastella vici]|nr:hypothetical protein [Niastella vici]
MEIDKDEYKSFFGKNINEFKAIGFKIDSLKSKDPAISSRKLSEYLNAEVDLKNLDGTNSIWWVKFDSISNNRSITIIDINMPGLRSNCTSFSFCYSDAGSDLKTRSKRNIEYEALERKWFLLIDNSNPCVD